MSKKPSPKRKPADTKSADPSVGAELANQAASSKDPQSFEEQLAQLTPEQAQMFLEVLELTMKKRRIMLAGYALALLAMLGGMFAALLLYGSKAEGEFRGWVFFIPFLLTALVIWGFGRWARVVGKQQPASARAR